MHIKDHSAAMKFFRTYDSAASKGKWKEFVDEMEFDSMLQEPRTMAADGGRIGFTLGGSDAYKRTTVYKKRLEAEKKGLTYDVKTKEFKPPKVTAVEGEASIKKINDWTKKWINKNAKNYGVREFDDFKKNLAKDWKKQLKVFEKDPKFRIYPNAILTTEEGLPYVKGLEIDKVTTPIKKDPTLGYEKIFYNEMLKDKAFNKKVTEYLKFVNLDKRFGSVRDEMAAAGKIAVGPHGKGFAPGGSKLAYLRYAKFLDDDVVHFMGDVLNSRELWNNNPAALNIYSIMEKNLDPKLVKAYRTKLGGAYSSWENNLRAVSELAGYDFDKVLAAQYKEAEKMRKVFNVKSLPFEFKYAQDHLFGLAEAKHLGDPKIAKQTLDNLVASTKEQNRWLGTKGFTQRRSKLMRNFKNASLENKESIITKLNTLAEDYVPGRLKYSVRKDGSLKIQNLQPEKTFKLRTAAYEKLAKTFPKNLQKTLFKTYQNAGIGKNCKAYGGRVGFSEAGAVGVSQCMNNAIQEHNKNLQSDDLTVRNKARSTQFNINKTKNMKSILELGGKGINRALRFGKAWGAEWEPIIEGAFYEWGRRKGYTHEQALEETFFAKMLPGDVQKDVFGTETQTGLFEGAEPLLEKELYEIKGENEFIDVDNRPPMQDPEFGQVIGERGTVKRYIDNEKALMAAHNDYNHLYSGHTIASKGRYRDPEKAEGYAKAMEKKWEEINSLEDKLDLDRDSYQAAVEKQQHTQGMRAFEYGEYGSGDTEKLAKQREKRRLREMEDKFPLMSKAELNKKLEDAGLYVDPKLRYKGQTVQRPKGLKFLPKPWTIDKARDYFRDLDKSAYFADNFKMEKAEGGIASLKTKW